MANQCLTRKNIVCGVICMYISLLEVATQQFEQLILAKMAELKRDFQE